MRKLYLAHDNTPKAIAMAQELSALVPLFSIEKADTIIVLGGDGYMLKTLHQHMGASYRFYGVNCGRVGFLMNRPHHETLIERINSAQEVILYPLRASILTQDHQRVELLAVNEVHILRSTYQAVKIRIFVDDVERMPELVSDGVILSTSAGSTAYNLSAYGPIIPLGVNLLALTPINPFRPRRWQGALLPSKVSVRWEVLEALKRPATAVADSQEIHNVLSLYIEEDRTMPIHLLFDPDHHLEERIIHEQFMS